MKKFIGFILAFAVAFCNLSLLSVDAKVIEPEVVKTEKWTTSYWIDDDKDTLYPYIDCEADIYNDGKVIVYAWNTHEFDGFATVNHEITLKELKAVDSTTYNMIKDNDIYTNRPTKISDFSLYDYNYYPATYNVSNSYHIGLFNAQSSFKYKLYGVFESLENYTWYGALPSLSYGNARSCPTGNAIIFTPKVEPTDTYNFRILGHEFTITPDLLQTTQLPEPPVADDADSLKARIAELEATIDMYETLLTSVSLERGDVNNDGFINAVDASQILAYYAYTSTGGQLDFMDFLEGKVDKEAG